MADQVSYSLQVDGAPASDDLLGAIKQIEVEDHAHMADMLRLRLAIAVTEDGAGWTLVDQDAFGRLAKLGVSVTVGTGPAVPLITAYVVEVDTSFSSEPGGSMLSVVAMDPTVLMHLEEKVKAWPNQADSDVASSIFSDPGYGFTTVVDDTGWSRDEKDHTPMQRGTDIQFLRQLADRNGYECFVETTGAGTVEGHFHPPKSDADPQGTLTVNMGAASNVNSFRARFDMLGPVIARAATIDPDDASAQSSRSDEPTQADDMGAAPTTPGDRPRSVLLSGLAMSQSGETDRYAQAVVDRSAWSIVAETEVNTVTYGGVLRAKRPVLVRGAGRQFSGRYYVERVLHTIASDGTYTQRCTLRRNAVGLLGDESFKEDR